MAEKFTSNNAPTPRGWKGPSEKGSVVRQLDGRLSANKADGDDENQDQRRNALDL
jgi:hypothetical protein